MIQKKKKKEKVQELHPPSPLHTRRLKSQHHLIITTFPNSTRRHQLDLGGGVIPPLYSPPLRLVHLGFLHSGWWISSSFDDVSSLSGAFALLLLEHLHGWQHSSRRPCYRWLGKLFAVRENLLQATVDFTVLSFP